MYFLFSREPATLEYIKDAMRNLVRETGTNIVKDEENLKVPTPALTLCSALPSYLTTWCDAVMRCCVCACVRFG
jgi:hypothetical protein